MYDYSNDILCMKILEEYEYNGSIQLEDDIILDFDKNNIPVAIEILS
ncbi:MAG: DUF2283 domain-containing protein, partial [Methanobacteriaceae archaeon]